MTVSPDNRYYPHMTDLKKLSSSLMYSPILVSWFILICLSLSPWMKAWLVHFGPHNNKLNRMCANTKDSKLKNDREIRVPTIIYPLFVQEDLRIIEYLLKILSSHPKKKDACRICDATKNICFLAKWKVKVIPVCFSTVLVFIWKF